MTDALSSRTKAGPETAPKLDLRIKRSDPVGFLPYDPAPPPATGGFGLSGDGTSVLALDRAAQYLFADETGRVVHSYDLPDDSDVFNCGGYLDKVLLYRQPALFEHLRTNGVTRNTFDDGTFPILATRSPQLDLLIYRVIRALRSETPEKRVGLFDLGCTVAEHFDLLDVMLRAGSGGQETAASALTYCGMDISPLVLCAARYIHGDLDPEHFRLMLKEGSSFEAPPGSFDIGLSVGVIHNLQDPVGGTERLLRMSRIATVLACWVCGSEKGFWLTSHHAAPIYVFGRSDIETLARAVPGRAFLVSDFVPEAASTQQRHFVGLSEEAIESLGSYHLVVTERVDLFPDLSELSLS